MALIAKGTRLSFDAIRQEQAPSVPPLYAGEAIADLDACYIKASDGLVYRSNGTASDAAAHFDGFALKGAAAGAPITLSGAGVVLRYSDGLLVPGARYYVAATAGRLDTAATTGGLTPVARAINLYEIQQIVFFAGLV